MTRLSLIPLVALLGIALSGAAFADPHHGYFKHDEDKRLHRAEVRRHVEEEHDKHWRDRPHHGHQSYDYVPARPVYIAPSPYATPYIVQPEPGINLNIQIP